MSSVVGADQRRLFLATALATRRQRQFAVAIATVFLLLFIAIVPFVRVPMAKMPAFIPSYEAALFFIDLITAVLLFDQFVRVRSIGILVLASGYLFDALIIVPHALALQLPLCFESACSPGLVACRNYGHSSANSADMSKRKKPRRPPHQLATSTRHG